MIKLCFCKWHEWQNLEVVELKTYKDFFDFYIKNSGKGCIFDVKDDENTE
ncbi:hypothetical protein CLHUN_02300 [Ruminiclostridium hungatei]|uniref:Uncharacterized protein n=1 Tax=Ruminiclostridium hungatei TaxID=48256 RepID=A0A1V4SRD5_RUMHU|nr:hypothetical protein CLHUN_02300 [Ruminiclostridium hungatei]